MSKTGNINFYFDKNIDDVDVAWKIIGEAQEKIAKIKGVTKCYGGGFNLMED